MLRTSQDTHPTTLEPEQDRTPDLFTDPSRGQGMLNAGYWNGTKSAARWNACAERPSLEDLRRLCLQRVPEVALRYFGRGRRRDFPGAESQSLYRSQFKPTAEYDDSIQMATTVLGQEIAMPIIAARSAVSPAYGPRGSGAAEATGMLG
jgi:hypothetical protein